MYVCMYACICMYVCMYVCIYDIARFINRKHISLFSTIPTTLSLFIIFYADVEQVAVTACNEVCNYI